MLTAMREFIMGSPTTPPMQATPGQAPPRSATPTRPSEAAPTTKPDPAPQHTATVRPGATAQEAVQWKQLGRTIHETHQNTGQVLTLLHDLTTPPASEFPSQVTEILEALTAVLESQRAQEQRMDRMEQHLERLLNVMRPRTVSGAA